MTGARAYALGYLAQADRHNELRRQAADRRRAMAGKSQRSRKRFSFGLHRNRIPATGRTATKTA
jgi:hypothetical protein